MFFSKKAAGVFALAATATASDVYSTKTGSTTTVSSKTSSTSSSTCTAKTVTTTTTSTVYKATKSDYATTVSVGYGPGVTITVDGNGKAVASDYPGEGAWADWSDDGDSSSSSSSSKTCKDVTKTSVVTVSSDTLTIHGSTCFVGFGPGPTFTVDGNGKTIGSSIPDGWTGYSTFSLAKATTTISVGGGNGAWGTDGADGGSGSTKTKTATATGTGKGGNGGNGGWGGDDDGTDGGSGSTKTKTATATATGKGGNGGNGGWGGNGDGGNGGSTKTKTATNTVWTGGAIPDPDDTSLWADWAGRPIGGGKVTKTITDGGDGGYTSIVPDPTSVSTSTTAPVSIGTNYAKQTGLAEPGCNSASDRSKWTCGGNNDISTNYYKTTPKGSVKTYNLVITNTTLNYDGIPRLALAINGQVPGPLIEANWGDTITVTITNKMQDNATTIHWHGIRQSGTNEQDGVPGVSECGIAPGQSKTYSFVANSYGTGWYHGHMLTQIGDGIRGPMVIHGPASSNYDIDMGPVMIDDLWTVTVAQQNSILAHAQRPGPAYNYMLNGHNVNANLTAGAHALWTMTPGKKHLFRLINSASQNVWTVRIDKHTMTVIAADYVPIKPYTTEWIHIGNGQRYDVIVEADQKVGNYFFRAVTQTGCPAATTNTGLGFQNGIVTYTGANLTLPANDYGNATATFFNGCEDEPIASLVPVMSKTGGDATTLSAGLKKMTVPQISQLATTDDGIVNAWFLNGNHMVVNYTQPTLKVLADGKDVASTASPVVLDVAGSTWVYFVIQNQFNPAHPMHLHGHDLSLLGQGQGVFTDSMVSTLNFVNPTRRDTVMLNGAQGARALQPGYTVIGFEADNPGAWLMHCHILWHADGGLALQWIERPKDIDSSKVTTDAYNKECQALTTYEAEGPWRLPTSGSSGLKRRTFFEEVVHGDVVRRSDSSEKRYLENIVKRAVGDGYRGRHARR